MLLENMEAAAAGVALPHVAPLHFYLWFVWQGGSGAALALGLLLLRCRSAQLRSVGRLGLLPAVCNVNEPLLFGVPVVLNPSLAVPFVLAPVLSATVAYAAFALDYHGGGTVLADMPQMMSRINGWLVDPTGIRVRVAKALEVLQSQPDVDGARIGCMGYCFGGTAVLELARSGASIAATVGFHSGLKTARPADAAQIKGRVLVCLGADDPLIPVAERNAFEEEMRRGGVDWQMHVYGGAQHSFTTPGIDARAEAAGLQGMKYHAEADRCSWRAMLGTFADVFGTTT
jgi:dienelactone hydrolase